MDLSALTPGLVLINEQPSQALSFSPSLPVGSHMQFDAANGAVSLYDSGGVLLGKFQPFAMDSASVLIPATINLGSAGDMLVSATPPAGTAFPATVGAIFEETN